MSRTGDRPNARGDGGGEQLLDAPVETTDEVTIYEEAVELERTIDLTGGLAIGVGTMVGAGIFVFPGLAAGRAGPAAALSFALGAVVALLVALPTSELATAMPQSGGGYYFISRGMGNPYGAVVGLSLWLGLIFASAFYLVGFGQYAAAVLAEVGVELGSAAVATSLAVLVGIALTAASIVGTENTTKLQNTIVTLLLGILTVFLAYGGLDALGLFGRQTVPETFAPFGFVPVLTTAAFVFTAYLGFAQVATVAGDIKKPGRNLPLAMVGSVLVVAVLNVTTVLVATSAFGSGRLATFGETALVEVARSFAGETGAVIILFAGLLATVSSANASILSSSRALYALSRDAVVPARAGTLNRKYSTPHVALALAGGPVVFLVVLGRVEVLAEVASFLHLLMYGLMCVTLVVLRRRDPEWYDPDFRIPGYPTLPVVGALASFGLLVFMQPLSQAVSLAILLGAAVWYRLYAPSVELKGVL
ncbi:Amino acid transporter [Halogranum gelatinilyticum]|uniref:Amino acid transporter n=1 Tax=Halogranum gelatinilyticum TaxID=660521 RepID=A0A1G9YXJ6_9EURY|nr:APC family permease [Halogranum gelatinilyticum]SDN13627.1 Amino acid transporter [Halogranum gelatinilyticum]